MPTDDRDSVMFADGPAVADLPWMIERYVEGDWRAIHDRCEDAADPLERSTVAEILAHHHGDPRTWVEHTPGAQFPLLVLGITYRAFAWQVRGSGRASTVPPAAAVQFLQLLELAHATLLHAAETRPADPTPWAHLLPVSMGLKLDPDVRLRYLAEADLRGRGFQPAYTMVVPAVSRKWGGSHELMFDVARTANRELPEASPGRIALPLAHHERRFHHYRFEDAAELGSGYYRDPDIAAELADAAHRSVLSPVYLEDLGTARLQSEFAYALAHAGPATAGNRRLAARLFDEMGDTGIDATPWTRWWPTKAAAKYTEWREWCARGALA